MFNYYNSILKSYKSQKFVCNKTHEHECYILRNILIPSTCEHGRSERLFHSPVYYINLNDLTGQT